MNQLDLQPTARQVRAQVRERLEREYLRLRADDRPALIEALEKARATGPADLALVEDELALVERRIAAVHDYLGQVHLSSGTGRAELDFCVQVDLGDGPRWLLLAELPVADDDVASIDSPLGQALLAAEVGESFEYTTPHGTSRATLVAVEGASSTSESAPPMPAPRRLLALDRQRALDLLAGRSPGVARVAFCIFGAPHLEVVNFAFDGEHVVFRVGVGAKLVAVNQGGRFALQIDDIDPASRTGWTVTVSGPVRRVFGVEAARLGDPLAPWPSGERRFVMKMTPSQVHGRFLTADG